MSKNVLLISVEALKARSAVHMNVDDKIILPEIKAAQDIEIVQALGSRLFERLQAGIAAKGLTADETLLLDEYVTDCLVWFTVAALPITGSYQQYTKGAIRKGSDNTEQPSYSDLLRLCEMYKNRAENYRERLIRYLYSNSAKYPLYSVCGSGGSGDDISPGRSGYSLQCWVDD